MNNAVESLHDKAKALLRTAAKRRWLALCVAAVAFAVWSAAVMRVPERYEASARVFVDTQTVLKPLMSGLTFQPDIDQQVRMLARTLVSRPNVEKLIATPDLHLSTATPREHEALVAKLMDQVQVAPTSSTNLYDITFRGPSAENARRLVEVTVDLFVHSGAESRAHDSREAEHFIDEQIKAYEVMLTASESRLKDFKVRNFGITGVPAQDYFARVSIMTDELDKLRSELGSAERQRDAYRRELDSEDPQIVAAGGNSGSGAEIEQRLDVQRRNLDDLLRRFTDAHPDVVGARHLIAQLETELAERREAERRAGPRGSTARLTIGSPVYQKLRMSLAEAESQAAGLRSKLGSAQARLVEVRAEAGRVPQVEAELAQLNRDYDIIRKNYDLMVMRRESALLGARLDESSQLAEFRVIDPARVSPSPVFPGRLHLTAIGALAAILIGLLASIAADLVSPTIDDAASLRALTGRPVLGSVSMTVSPRMLQRRRTNTIRYSAAAGVLLAVQALWITWIALKPTLG
jgi:polysaccharide chain length determinant protein (PEP-CTERM system associated)